MIIDGKQIATDIIASLKREVATLPYTPRLTVFTCAPNFETQKFLALKRRKASEAGIALQLIEFDSEVTVPEILLSMKQAHLAADGSRDIPRFISLYQQGLLPVDRLMSERIKLEEINEGFDKLADGGTVRMILVP